jgi:hypothetical protein
MRIGERAGSRYVALLHLMQVDLPQRASGRFAAVISGPMTGNEPVAADADQHNAVTELKFKALRCRP